MGSFAIAALVLPIGLAAIIIASMVSARRRAASGRDSRPLTLVATRFIAVAYAGLTLVATVVTVVVALVSDAVGVTIPVRQFWPQAHPWITVDQGPTATVTGGGFALADVTVSGLGPDARLLLASGHALQGLTFTVIAIVIAVLCHRLLSGQPFKPALSRSITVTAVAIAAGGILWQLCFWIGGSIASAQVLTVTGWQSHELYSEAPGALEGFDPLVTGLPEPTVAFSIDFWPLLLGLALAAVAAAFRYGEHLQRDTEGLI